MLCPRPPRLLPPHKAEVGRAWQLAAAAEINKPGAPGWTGCRSAWDECLPCDEAMRTELQREATSSGSEWEVGAHRSQCDSPFDQAIALAGVKWASFRGQRKVSCNLNDFCLGIKLVYLMETKTLCCSVSI